MIHPSGAAAVGWRLLEMPKISDVRGNLTPINSNVEVPFDIQRIYYIYDVPSGSLRAGHAHKRLQQLFLALSGSFMIHLDDGVTKSTITLNRPHIGLYVPSGVWRVIDDFSGGGVCLVLASAHYDESDYIRSYAEFETYVALKQRAGSRT
ncbi:MAG: FdtA/QdtA family cupin domain-containing protein [Acetobacteraceae bacterium]|nr:FdtA/QdtA family cupin domain-containing protein [Acetobacteraceae bacterium]